MEGSESLELLCSLCGRVHPVGLAWRCSGCGGVLDLGGFTPVMPPVLRDRAPSLWRYASSLPVPEPAFGLGEGFTPLVAAPGRPDVALKIDYLMPSGSFKDRGAVVLVALAARLGVTRMVADSSGNAGAAIACYAARAGIGCEVFVPAATSPGKTSQLSAYGAVVRRVEGSRSDTAAAASVAASEPGVFYASHVYNPFFLHGTKTYVFELWEQLGGRLPPVLVLPAGNGTLVLGAYLGVRELAAQGLIDRLPSIIAVQAAACAPLAAPFRHPGMPDSRGDPPFLNLSEGTDISGSAGSAGTAGTAAEGIAIARPARGAQIVSAVRETGGSIVTVTDDQILAARAVLGRAGFYVEPTAAVCWAAVTAGAIDVPAGSAPPYAVVPLCGSGLKSGGAG